MFQSNEAAKFLVLMYVINQYWTNLHYFFKSQYLLEFNSELSQQTDVKINSWLAKPFCGIIILSRRYLDGLWVA